MISQQQPKRDPQKFKNQTSKNLPKFQPNLVKLHNKQARAPAPSDLYSGPRFSRIGLHCQRVADAEKVQKK